MLKSVSRMALGRGLFGGSRPWLVIGVVTGGLRLLVRMAKKEPEVVYRETLDAGHSLVITHLDSEKG